MRSGGSNRVPPRYTECRFPTFAPKTTSQERALTAAQHLANGTIGSLVLVGRPGVGKSHLAAAVVRDIEERLLATPADEIDGRVAPQPTYPVWQNVADLVIGLRMELDLPGWEREYAGTARTLGRWRGLVVLDDLGREKSTDWSGEVIYALCNHRYEQRLPTLVTSNLTPNDLALSPYWPVISRLAEDGELIEITGPDHRVDR